MKIIFCFACFVLLASCSQQQKSDVNLLGDDQLEREIIASTIRELVPEKLTYLPIEIALPTGNETKAEIDALFEIEEQRIKKLRDSLGISIVLQDNLSIPDSSDVKRFQKIHRIKLLNRLLDKKIKAKPIDYGKLPTLERFNIIPFSEHQKPRKQDQIFEKYAEKLIASYSRIIFSADKQYAAFVFSYFIEHDCTGGYQSPILVKRKGKKWKICYRVRD